MSTRLLDSRAVKCSCRGLLLHTKSQRMSIYQHPETAASTFCGICRFESILKPVNEDVDVTQGVETDTESSSHIFQEYIPCSFAYKIVSSADPDFSRPLAMYRGEDAAEKLYVIYNWKLNSCLTSILLLQNQCWLLLQNHDRLTVPLSVIYAQNHLKMINCEIIVTLQEIIVVMLTTSVIWCIEYPKLVGSYL